MKIKKNAKPKEELRFQRANLIVPRCYPRNEKIKILDTVTIEIDKKIKGHDMGIGFALYRAIDEADKLIKERKADAAVWVHIADFGSQWWFDFDLIKILSNKKISGNLK